MTAPTTPEQATFHEWFKREFPVVNGTRERYGTTTMMDLMFEAWIGGQASAALSGIDAAVLVERERCAVLATELAVDAAQRLSGGYPVHFGREVGDAIREGVKS